MLGVRGVRGVLGMFGMLRMFWVTRMTRLLVVGPVMMVMLAATRLVHAVSVRVVEDDFQQPLSDAHQSVF